jgi:aminopeptidase-like protein
MNKLPYSELIKFAERNYLKNRTTVSRDIKSIFEDIEKTLDLPIKYHKYKTGKDYGTWIIPPSWNVVEAWLKNSKGELIASYEDHPLFLSPYSKEVHTKLSKRDLLKHIFSEPKRPNAFAYNWRYAYDANLKLKDWGISLPKNLVDNLPEDTYEIYIETEVFDSEMLVGEILLKGEREEEIVFLANYCHPGQMNDSFSGLIMFMQVMNTLAQKERRRFTYRFLFMPETIGSAAFISDNPMRLKKMIGTIFSEMVGWGEKWYIKSSLGGDTYIDILAKNCIRAFDETEGSDFMTMYRNDEMMFNSVQAGVPSLSVQKYPYDEYHTSDDKVENVLEEEIQKAHDMVCYMVSILEKDNIYKFSHNVPFWMTRYKLFSDDVYEPDEFKFKFDLVYRYLDGNLSIAELAVKLNVSFESVYKFIEQMKNNDLVMVKTEKYLKSIINRDN